MYASLCLYFTVQPIEGGNGYLYYLWVALMNFSRILIVGSWAKEQITVEHLKRFSYAKVFVYMDVHNPGILPLVDGHFIGSLSDINTIVDYARACHADLVLITTAAPFQAGLCDALETNHIKAFGPTQIAGKLETDKAFTRQLMKKYLKAYTPDFSVFTRAEEAIAFARQHDWQVAVKPVGLTDGLGVRVYGDQLPDQAAVKAYINTILQNDLSGHHKVIVEEKLTGTEFSLQCLVNETEIVPTPAVQDFKKKLPGEKGPNTASMGSYSDRQKFLPFMEAEDYDRALDCCRGTVEAFFRETGEVCRGFLYGQFMISNKGLKLIEYNFRPGDPEWMNTLLILNSSLLDAIQKIMNKERPDISFLKKATVCKYLVPPQYPQKLNQTLNVDFEPQSIRKHDVHLYYSCGEENSKLHVGSERGIALLAAGNSIEQAHDKIEDAISHIRGSYFYRHDIGTNPLARSKIEMVSRFSNDLKFRNAGENEFLEIQEFVGQCPPLEQYPPHVFKIILRCSSDCCFVATKGEKRVGWVMGLLNTAGDTYFLWQIGIHPSIQGEGAGKILLGFVEKNVRLLGCDRIQLTIDPENIASQKLFEKCGYKNVSEGEKGVIKINGNPAVRDFYNHRRHFMIYEKEMIDDEKPNMVM